MFFSKSKELQIQLNRALIEIKTLQFKNNEQELEYNKLTEKIDEAQKLIEELKKEKSTLEAKLDESKELLVNEMASGDNDKFQGLFELFGFENKNLKSSLLDIQSNIVISTDSAKETLSNSETIDKGFEDSFKSIKDIESTLTHLNLKSNSINKIVQDLSGKVKDIGRAIEQIKEVVLQINILSLNASVEAASAGEAGKGFAVVAGEVKNLANKTSLVAKNIEDVVKSIQENIMVTTEEFDGINTTIGGINSKANNFNNELHSMYETTKNSLSTLGSMKDGVFMSLAKLDHVIWKVNTYLSVYEGKPAFAFVDHHNCRLGKWYESGEGKKYFAHTPSYKSLEKPHSIVHNGTHKVFDDIDENIINVNIGNLIKAFEEMEKGSLEVFATLDKILHENE